jgi:dipeptidyl aminopeptidase/acylaminoacyl peptidase
MAPSGTGLIGRLADKTSRRRRFGSLALVVAGLVALTLFIMLLDTVVGPRLSGCRGLPVRGRSDGTRQESVVAFSDGEGIQVARPDGSCRHDLPTAAEGSVAASWSPSGTQLAYVTGLDLWVVGADGTGHRKLFATGSLRPPVWSPDGSRLALGWRDERQAITIVPLDGSPATTLTQSVDQARFLSWSPDGARLAFSGSIANNSEIYVIGADGTGLTNLSNHPAWDTAPAWSPDGTRLAFFSTRDGGTSVRELYVVGADGTGLARLTAARLGPDLLSDETSQPIWSPSGNLIAFVVREPVPSGFEDVVYTVNASFGTSFHQIDRPKRGALHTFAASRMPAGTPAHTRSAFLVDPDRGAGLYVRDGESHRLIRITP